MPEAFNLRRMLEEIAEDEKVSTSKRTKVSQADIQKLLKDRNRERQDASPEGDRSSVSDGSSSRDAEGRAAGNDRQPYPEARRGSVGDPSGICGETSIEQHPLSQPTPHPDNLVGSGTGRPILKISDGVLPARVIRKYRVIPLYVGERVIELAMENPDDLAVIYEVEVLTGRRVEPVRVQREVMERSLRLFRVHGMEDLRPAATDEPGTADAFRSLLEMLVISEGSDLLIAQGSSPWIKTPVHMESTGMPAVTALDCVRFAKSLMNEDRWEKFLAEGVVSFSHEDPAYGRFRVQVFRERGAPSLVVRRIPHPLPTLEELGLPSWIEELALSESGLVIVSGPSGHGKTTTLHAMVHRLNRLKTRHIVTIEDPIEIVHHPVKSQIIQREIGRDVASRREGIRQAMQQGAHVIVVGELNASGVFLQALSAAASGRLVLTTLDSGPSNRGIHQVVHTVPAPLHSSVLSMLENTKVVIVAQKLLTSGLGSGARPECHRVENTKELEELFKALP